MHSFEVCCMLYVQLYVQLYVLYVQLCVSIMQCGQRIRVQSCRAATFGSEQGIEIILADLSSQPETSD